MRLLIVNGDDLGASTGINRGILEAHAGGILTSASLLVDGLACEDAADCCRDLVGLSVGLHAAVDGLMREPSANLGVHLRDSLEKQIERFERVMRRPPTHLDSHHNVHRDPRALPHFLDVAIAHGLCLREHSMIRHVSRFYGSWGGRSHPEQIGVDSLLAIAREEVADGITEIGCHPGYVDADHVTSYRVERETELRTLRDPRLRAGLEALGIRLVGHGEAARLLARSWCLEGPERLEG